jgi:heterotetrameric sarcosine oxidase gamma subunit
MMLPTLSDLPIASPLPATSGSLSPDEQAQAARTTVGLGEISGRTLLHLRGNDAESVLQAEHMNIGDVIDQSGLLARLRRDEFVLLARDRLTASEQIVAKIGERRVTLTDITHGRCGLLLIGARAPDVLPKVCALDFDLFLNLHAAQTSLAKVRTLIVRADVDSVPAYGLFVDRSLAAYVWGVVYDAAQEFEGVALSNDGFESLRMGSLW